MMLPNKALKLTKLSPAPGFGRPGWLVGGAGSCPRPRETAGTASQLNAGVRQTQEPAGGRSGERGRDVNAAGRPIRS